VCGVYESLRKGAFQTGKADVETGPQEEIVPGLAQIHFRIDGRIGREVEPHFSGCDPHSTFKAGRPARGKHLLRVRALSRSAGSR
jgi:hypothetical protein